MIPNNIFYKIMYKSRTIEFNADSGRKYIVEYHRSPFWSYEIPTLKLFFRKKINTWHGQVWEVFDNGGSCGFGTCCIITMFPRKEMKRFLNNEVKHLERIFNAKSE